MMRSRSSFILITIFLGMVGAVSDAISQEKHEEFYRVMRTVTEILQGKKPDLAYRYIPQRARLICGQRYENLWTAVTGDVDGLALVDTSYHGVMVEAQTNPSEDMGFIILKTMKSDTTQVRFHTIVFMRDSAGEYKIHLWHAGGCN